MELWSDKGLTMRMKMYHEDNGNYAVTFVAPDIPGIYSWKVAFQDKGYLFDQGCEIIKEIKAKPSEEEQRFFLVALPYYVALVTTVLATLFLFVAG